MVALTVILAVVFVLVTVARDVDRRRRRHDALHGGMLSGGRRRRRRWGR